MTQSREGRAQECVAVTHSRTPRASHLRRLGAVEVYFVHSPIGRMTAGRLPKGLWYTQAWNPEACWAVLLLSIPNECNTSSLEDLKGRMEVMILIIQS